MIVKATTQIYNDVFNKQYKSLLKFARQDDDNLHDSYLKLLKKITEKGFTAHTITELHRKLKIYIKTIIYNNFKTQYILKKNNVIINWEAELMLEKDNTSMQEDRQYYDELEYFTIKLFEYLKKKYSEADQYLFRVYYLYDKNNKKITYKKLSEITGYSLLKVYQIIKKIKIDLKSNLINYINGVN